MKFKVTVELLPEGIKKSQIREISAALILLNLKNEERLRKVLKVMINDAQMGAAHCMIELYRFITEKPGTTVLEYEVDGERKCHLVKDLDEIPQACWDYIKLHEVKKKLFDGKSPAEVSGMCPTCEYYPSWNCPRSCLIIKGVLLEKEKENETKGMV